MTALASLLVILTVSFLCTRLATTALTLTGLSRDLAHLQSVSAFTGVGFTTTESEQIVNHPVRRRILILLMIVGNVGVVTSVASLLLSFAGVSGSQGVTRLLWLAGGVALLWMLATRAWVERALDLAMRWALDRWTRLRAIDYAQLLDLSGHYGVRQLSVDEGDWVEGRRLEELHLFDEGIVVLGIHRADGDYLGVPRGETRVEADDRLVLYGRAEDLAELDERRSGPTGDEAHERGLREQSAERESQERREQARRGRRD